MKLFNTKTILAALISLVALASCNTQNLFIKGRIERNGSYFRPDTAYRYVIRKDDKISISIYNHDDMSIGSVFGIYNSNEVYGKWLLVDADGNITIPKLGRVHLQDSTVPAAEKMLREMYKQWIVDPTIVVKVLNKEVNVIGDVATPGKYVLEKDNNKLIDIIAKAGDFGFYANKKKIQVVRYVNDTPRSVSIDLTNPGAAFEQNVAIRPGDIVYVPSRKSKTWDKRSGSIIIPLATIISSAVLINNLKH